MHHSISSLTIYSALALFMTCCCCGGLTGGFDSVQFQNLLQGNLDNVLEEAIPQPELPPPPEEPALEEAQPEEQPPAELPAEESQAEPAPTEAVDEETAALQEAIEEHIAEGAEGAFTFGCDDPALPMPADAAGCVSIAGFTSYSTATGRDELNAMYDSYFIDKGWGHFDMMIDGDVINAWHNEADNSMAMLSFLEGGGENGQNQVTLGVLAADAAGN